MHSRPLVPVALVAALLASTACQRSTSAPASACKDAATPIAVAGPDRQVTLGSTVALDGSSFGATGQATYLWRMEAVPPGSQAVVGQASVASTTFVADRAGTYVASFTVRDDCATSVPDMVTILVPGPICADPPPVAAAGPDQVLVNRAYGISLDGSASRASGAGSLTYRWSVDSRPPGSTVTLYSSTAALASFNPDRAGAYVMSLVVNDGCQDSPPDTVTITVPNSPPSAYVSISSEFPALLPISPYLSAWDADNDPLTYAWTVQSGPAGSAASVSNATAANPTFTPDLPGTYVLSVAVSDGAATVFATATFKAVDYPPVARAGASQAASVGSAVALDGTASSDTNKTPLTFAWTLAAPAGSTATLAAADTARPTFSADLPGTYRATLAVTSGGQVASDSVTVAVWPAVERLPHRVVDAAYSDALDMIVMVAADPHALYLLDPSTGTETVVPLALAPNSLALAPDGLSAAVGHTGAVTSVDLSLETAEAPVVVSGDVADLALGSSRVAWIVPRPAASSDRARVMAEPLDGGTETWVTSAVTGTAKAKLRPSATELYVAGGGYSSLVEHYNVSGATPVLVNSASSYGSSSCGDLWFSQAGTRLFTRCGTVYLVSSSWTEDLTVAGSLNRPTSYSFAIRHLSDSTAAGQLSAITSADTASYSSTDDQALRSWSAADLTSVDVAPLPTETVGGTAYHWGGRFVFYRSDGSARYVLLQLDPASGVLEDFGWVTF
jgi:chitinase